MENPSQILLPVLVRHHTVSDIFGSFVSRGLGDFLIEISQREITISINQRRVFTFILFAIVIRDIFFWMKDKKYYQKHLPVLRVSKQKKEICHTKVHHGTLISSLFSSFVSSSLFSFAKFWRPFGVHLLERHSNKFLFSIFFFSIRNLLLT